MKQIIEEYGISIVMLIFGCEILQIMDRLSRILMGGMT